MQREVDVSDRELASVFLFRHVTAYEIFREGMVYVVRTDTWEAFEPRPATAQEAQRFLPAVESTLQTNGANAPLLDQAAAAQGNGHRDAKPENVPEQAEPEDEDTDDDEPEDDGLEELTPAQKAAKESAAARKARRGAKGKAGSKP